MEIDEGVDGFAGGEELVAAEDLVVETDPEERFFAQVGDDGEDVVVGGGAGIFGGNFEDR